MESQRIEFTLEEDPLKTVPSNRRGAQQTPKLSLTDTEYVSVKFGGRNISIHCHASFLASFATELHEEALETFTRVVLYFYRRISVFRSFRTHA